MEHQIIPNEEFETDAAATIRRLAAEKNELLDLLEKFADDESSLAYDFEFHHDYGNLIEVHCNYCGKGHATADRIVHDTSGDGCFVGEARRLLKEYGRL